MKVAPDGLWDIDLASKRQTVYRYSLLSLSCAESLPEFQCQCHTPSAETPVGNNWIVVCYTYLLFTGSIILS